MLEGKKKTHRIYDEIIEKKRMEVNDDNESTMCILKLWLKQRKQDIPGEASSKLNSYEQLRHLLADLFGAGVDTTLATLRWFLLYMAKYKQIQKLIHQVIFRNPLNHFWRHYYRKPEIC